MATVVRAGGTEVIKVQIPPAGLPAEMIYKQLERYGLYGALEVDGFSVTNVRTVFAGDRLVYIPQCSAAQAGTVSKMGVPKLFAKELEAEGYLAVPQGGGSGGIYSEDPTYSIIDRYQLSEVPPLEELKNWVIKKPDGLVFPITRHFFEAFRSVNSEILIFELEHDGVCCSILSSFLRPFLDIPRTGHTEASFIHFWESLVTDIIDLFCVRSVVMDRDTNLDPNTTSKRPDRLMFVDNVPVGRAKEKRPGFSDLIPLQELKEQTEWVYGGVPYLLGYSAVGATVNFVGLYQRNPSAGVLIEQLITLDLFQLRDRIRLLVVLFNIARLFPVLSRLCLKYDVEPDYLPLPKWLGDKVVQVQARNVVKTYKSYDKYCRAFNIYKAIKDVPRVELCITKDMSRKRNRNSTLIAEYSLTFKPRLTFCKRARSLQALVQIAETLKELHNLGWVHRDLDWRNIGRFGSDWYIIDFDEAERVPCKNPHMLCEDAHAPEMMQGVHGHPVDVWGIGHLIETSKVLDSATGLLQLKDQCLADDPTSRPTMPQVLERLRQLSKLLDG